MEFLVPAALFLAAVLLALYLPRWRAVAGAAAELVLLSSLLELAARDWLPASLFPPGCVLVTFVAFVLLRTHKILSVGLDAGVQQAAPDACDRPARWTALGSRIASGFDPAAVASSLHLLPFFVVVLLPALVTGTYVPAQAQNGIGLVFGLAALAARRFGAVILVICLSAAFAGAFYQRGAAHRGETSASVAAASR